MPVPAPQALSIAYVYPATGLHTAQTPIRLLGAKFQTGATVSVGGSPATSVVVKSPTTITCTTPTGSVGPADIVVTNPDGSSVTLPGGANGFAYT